MCKYCDWSFREQLVVSFLKKCIVYNLF